MKARSMTPEEAQRAAAGLTCSGPCLDDTSDKHEQSGDWPDGQYACEFRAESGQSSAWTARHELSGAPGVPAGAERDVQRQGASRFHRPFGFAAV